MKETSRPCGLDRAAPCPLPGACSKRQAGAALVVSLLLLLVMTLLGVAAVQSTTLQEHMAGNLRNHNLAFQAAEAALRAGEQWAIDTGGGTQRLEDLLTNDETLADWDGSTPTGVVAMPGAAGVAENPVFHVGPAIRMRVGLELPPQYENVYLITARGVGGTASSVVILRSLIRPVQ